MVTNLYLELNMCDVTILVSLLFTIHNIWKIVIKRR